MRKLTSSKIEPDIGDRHKTGNNRAQDSKCPTQVKLHF